MRSILIVALLASSAMAGHRGGGGGHSHGTGSSSHDHAVRGYTKKSGTYVAPHRQSDPDRMKQNNFSTRGNVNPYTGKRGTR
jgi:hypothetical protein